MGPLGRIALVVIAISFITFVALFGRLPAMRKTPIGFLQRLLCDHIPALLVSWDNRLTGGRTTRSLSRLFNYLLYKKNPVVLIIFLGLVTGSASLFLRFAYYRLSSNQLFPIPFLVIAPYLFTYLCAADTSIYITPANHTDRLHDYPYDHILFHPSAVCSTCNLIKPARSKHCSLCNACVSRSDHHCPWINNCLGRSNYRYFLFLLFALFLLEAYGAYLSFSLLRPQLFPPGSNTSGLSFFSIVYWNNVGDNIVRAVNAGGLSIAGVGLLAGTTAPLPLGLLAYHVYLIWAGMTTNESQKWADWREDMADGVVFKAKRSDILAREREIRVQRSRYGNSHSSISETADETIDEAEIDWPVASDQHIVRTNDGRPPNGREHMYEQIWSLGAVDNIYDLGFWDNVMYVLKGR